jgi:hypothetical protein
LLVTRTPRAAPFCNAVPVRICVAAYAPFVMQAGNASGASSDGGAPAAAPTPASASDGELENPFADGFALTGFDVEFRRAPPATWAPQRVCAVGPGGALGGVRKGHTRSDAD